MANAAPEVPQKWSDQFRKLMDEGFMPHFVDVDKRVVEQTYVCPIGMHVTHYRGFRHYPAGQYRAFAVDYNCDAFKEV